MSGGSGQTRALFGSHPFRLYLTAQLLGGSGMWMLRMAKDWLVLELTGSPAAVGVVVALQFLPLLIVGPLGGVIADRHDKRRLVLGAQTASALVAVALAVLTLTGTVAVWHLYVLAVALGLVAAIEMPARQVLVNEVVGDSGLRPAVSLTNAVGQGGGLVGPALAGLVIAEVGQGWAFGVNALVCVAVVALIAAIRPGSLHRAPTTGRTRGQLREGFGYVTSRPHLLGVVVLAGFMGALGLNGPVVLSTFAQEVWGTGARGFGLYNSASAVGAVVGAVVAARRRRLRLRTVVLGAALFGAAEIVAAAMPTHAAFLTMLAVVGAGADGGHLHGTGHDGRDHRARLGDRSPRTLGAAGPAVLARLVFTVATPCLLLVTVAHADLHLLCPDRPSSRRSARRRSCSSRSSCCVGCGDGQRRTSPSRPSHPRRSTRGTLGCPSRCTCWATPSPSCPRCSTSC